MTFIPQYYDKTVGHYAAECPFKVRDLVNDECYSGSGQNRCEWFVKYDWEHHHGCIACNHPVDVQKNENNLDGQLIMEFD